jgi:hypothetical protein
MENLENFVNYIINNNIKKIEINNKDFEKYDLYKFEELFSNLEFNENNEIILNNIIIKFRSLYNYREILEFKY